MMGVLRQSVALALALLGVGLSGCDRSPGSFQPTVVSSSSPPPVIPPSPSVPPPPTEADRVAASSLRQEGLEYRNQGRYDEAIVALEASVKRDPETLSGYVILGWTLHLADKGMEAAQVLESALEQDPNHVPALNALGIVYLVSGDLEAAIQTHEKAIALESDNEIGYFNLSLAYQRLGQDEAAMTNAERATELEPGNPHPWLALAIAYWSNDNISEAQDAYRQAIHLDSRYDTDAAGDRLQRAAFSPSQIQLVETIRQSR